MTILFTGCGAKKATLIFVTYSESVIEPIEVTADGIDSLVIPEPTKEGFGSLILDKWGTIGYNEKAIRLTILIQELLSHLELLKEDHIRFTLIQSQIISKEKKHSQFQ